MTLQVFSSSGMRFYSISMRLVVLILFPHHSSPNNSQSYWKKTWFLSLNINLLLMFDDKYFLPKSFSPSTQPAVLHTPIHLIRVVCYIRNTFSGFAVHSIATLSLTGSNPCEWKSAQKKRVEFDVFREDFKRFSNFFFFVFVKWKFECLFERVYSYFPTINFTLHFQSRRTEEQNKAQCA